MDRGTCVVLCVFGWLVVCVCCVYACVWYMRTVHFAQFTYTYDIQVLVI